MGIREKRARDADRDLAVEFIQGAWVDGQLTRAEHDERVERVLRARTVADVEHEVRDLQGPGGAVWRPTAPPAAPTTPTASSRPAPTSARVESRNTVVEEFPEPNATAALGRLAALGGVGLLAVVAFAGTGGDVQEAELVLEHGDVDVVELAGATESEFGTSDVYSVRVRPDGRARVVVPSEEASSGAYVSVYDWDSDTWSARRETTPVGTTLDLTRLMEVDMESIVDHALAEVEDGRMVTWLQPGTVRGAETCLRTVTTDHGTGSEVIQHYDCDGEPVD